jgi:hypothetical protein
LDQHRHDMQHHIAAEMGDHGRFQAIAPEQIAGSHTDDAIEHDGVRIMKQMLMMLPGVMLAVG